MTYESCFQSKRSKHTNNEVFATLKKPYFETHQYTEILNVHAGSHLLKGGDPDENVFIVQGGLVSVYITSIGGGIIPLKLVKTGDCVTSLLSLIIILICRLLEITIKKILSNQLPNPNE